MVNFAMKAAGCMYVCLVFIELLTKREAKIPLVLFCGESASSTCQYCFIQKYFSAYKNNIHDMPSIFFPLPTTLNFYFVLILKNCLGLMEINVIDLRCV